MEALGMVETRGLIAAIEASDVMLKTADVHLVNQEYVGGGLVATLMTGDVAAIKTAVDAAATAVRRLSEEGLLTTDVIPRPDGMLHTIFERPTPPRPKMTAVAPEQAAPEPESEAAQSVLPEAPKAADSTPEAPATPAEKATKLDAAQLRALVADKAKAAAYLGQFKINELRNFAKRQPAFVKQHKNVYQLSKNNLVNTLIDFYQHEA